MGRVFSNKNGNEMTPETVRAMREALSRFENVQMDNLPGGLSSHIINLAGVCALGMAESEGAINKPDPEITELTATAMLDAIADELAGLRVCAVSALRLMTMPPMMRDDWIIDDGGEMLFSPKNKRGA
jgi:hypothetical protein